MQIPQMRRTPTQRRDGNNGGFPTPPEGEPTHVVHCAHAGCGSETRVRLPSSLPDSVVHRVVCDVCKETFGPGKRPPAGPDAPSAAAAPTVAAVAAVAVATRDRGAELLEEVRVSLAVGCDGIRGRIADSEVLSGLPRPEISRNRLWAWASLPLALLGVVAGLALIQGDSDAGAAATTATADSEALSRDAKFISEPGYSLALPAGWKQTNAPDGATFKALSRDGLAEATLWIEKDPTLSFKQFERRSLAQLTALSPDAEIVDRVDGPTIETTITEMRAEPITGGAAAPYRVTLRGAGPYRLYFATAEQPGARAKLRGDIELMHGSLRPDVALQGVQG